MGDNGMQVESAKGGEAVKKRNIPYSTYITPEQATFLGLLARVRGTPETVVLRAAVDSYFEQCKQEVKSILALQQKALAGANSGSE